ncbi:MAG: coniferyl-alcohol dehydrogenase [Alphaproteobacteria bacterium]|nr:coniferyl-alcohol dehydrogenase [Alphaproteobacteria bacterium]
MDLKGKTIVVTGAASGIGAATAATLTAEGARVVAVDRNAPDGAAQGNYARFVQADLGDPAGIEAAVEVIGEGIDGLANIAGLPPTAGREATIRVNFLGLRHLTTRMIDRLNDGASIVNMASLAGFDWANNVAAVKALLALEDFAGVEALCAAHGVDDARSYFFSKEALVVWTLMNRWTWRERGIRMNAVSPGPVETPILPDFLSMLGARAEEDMAIMDRPGQPEDIAPVVAFLMSDGSRWLRGANLPCDGGMSSHLACEAHGFGG